MPFDPDRLVRIEELLRRIEATKEQTRALEEIVERLVAEAEERRARRLAGKPGV
jgi:hypothetical protein